MRRLFLGALAVFALCALSLLSACDLARPAVEIRSYLPTPLSTRADRPLDARLGRFEVASAFEGKPLVWRLNDQRYESDFYNELLVTPRAMLMSRTAEWFSIEEGTAQKGLAPSPYLLEAYANELYGDARSAPAQAVLRMNFKLTAIAPTPHVVFEREYSERVALDRAQAEALVRGWGIAQERILARLQADLSVKSR